MKKCHYDVLNLSRNAEDSEIKSAYRKLALKWHPDKNLQDPDGAKEQFQFVQQAYEVLSDMHERAWYDKHREQILRGGDTEYEDNSLDVFQYFTATCYKGFGDDPKSFYSVYSDVFKTLATEDIEYMDTKEEFETIPMFGKSQSDYEHTVGPFYAYWQSYCTKKSYAWVCEHNINDVRDRRVAKIIEKENKKLQQKARKERNEEVRNLVAFVRKRDKRVQAYKKVLEEKAEQNRAKQEQNRIEQILKRQKELKDQIESQNQGNSMNEGYEELLRKLESQFAGSSDEGESDVEATAENNDETVANGANQDDPVDAEELYDDDLYCVACNKSFKNQKSFKNHESSKKHWDSIIRLKKEMQDEEQNYESSGIDSPSDSDGEVPLPVNNTPKNKKNKKKRRTKNFASLYDDDGDDGEGVEEVNGRVDVNTEEKKVSIDNGSCLENEMDEGKSKTKTKGKSDMKLKKKPSRKATEIIVDPSIADTIDINHICVTCNEKFDSKNKLFTHLKKVGHGVFIPKPQNGDVRSSSAAAAAAAVAGGQKKGKKKK